MLLEFLEFLRMLSLLLTGIFIGTRNEIATVACGGVAIIAGIWINKVREDEAGRHLAIYREELDKLYKQQTRTLGEMSKTVDELETMVMTKYNELDKPEV